MTESRGERPNNDQDAPAVDDERWMVIRGRRWRRTDPVLPSDVVEALKSHLGRARSTVGIGRRNGDDDAIAAARARVDLAKHGLGERGIPWWESQPSERIARAKEALDRLDGMTD